MVIANALVERTGSAKKTVVKQQLTQALKAAIYRNTGLDVDLGQGCVMPAAH